MEKKIFEGITNTSPTDQNTNVSANSINKEIKTIASAKNVSADQQKLIDTIKQYCTNKRFCGHLKGEINVNNLESLDVEQLQEKLDKIDRILSTRGNQGMIDNGMKMAMVTLENIVDSKTTLNVRGTTEACWVNELFLDKLEQVKIKYNLNLMENVKLDPALELSLIIFQTGLMCHKRNGILADTADSSIDLDAEI
jgi:hypothetical protein